MAVTKMENMINPEVMGDMINAKIEALLKLTPFAKVDKSLQGTAGDTKTVPSWNYIGDAVEVGEGEEVDLTAMSVGTRTFTIGKIMKAVGITQEALNSGLGDPRGQAESQLAKSAAGKVENDLMTAALGSSFKYGDGTAQISYAGIVDAVDMFGDEEETKKILFIHPEQKTKLRKDSDFISADKYNNNVMMKGEIGEVAGTKVISSKRVRSDAYYSANESGELTIVADTTKTNEMKKGDVKLMEVLRVNGISKHESATVEGFEVGDKVSYNKATKFWNVIIKLEADDAQTDFTEDEFPALTIFLKKDIQVDHDWKARTQTHEITMAKYYGVALTNEAKVVVANFKK
jgi:N4-gp56 family major capsid protein